MSTAIRTRVLPGIGLLALALLFVIGFRNDKHFIATLLVFTLPPLLLSIFVWLGSRRAAFWAGVFGLFWFAHGVMTAYSHPQMRLFGWLEILFALVVVLSSSWPGLKARFGRRP